MLTKDPAYIYIINICILLLLVGRTQSARDRGNCVLIDEKKNYTLTDEDWYFGIRLNPINDYLPPYTEILRYKTINISYETANELPSKNKYNEYLIGNVEWNVSEFVLKLGREFSSYEEHETSIDIQFTITFLCSNEEKSKLTFYSSIKDTNNHDPKFLNGPYQYTLPMPLPKNYNLDILGKIQARDVDLTNKQVIFNFDQNEVTNKFLISSIGQNSTDKKNYLTEFVTTTTVNLEDDVTFGLHATDSGIPSRTANTTITIVVDKENSLPKFSSSIYTADLRKWSYGNEHSLLLDFSGEKITLNRGYKGVEKFQIKGVSEANKKHLHLTQSDVIVDKGIVISIELINLSEEFLKQRVLTVVLTAVKDALEANTVLQILLPGEALQESKTEQVTCSNSTEIEEYPVNGFMIATVLLSLVCIGLVIFITFSFISEIFWKIVNKVI